MSVDDFKCKYIWKCFFLGQHFCAYKGQCVVDYVDYAGIFFKRTSESAITVIIMPIYEHVMSVLTYEILAFSQIF